MVPDFLAGELVIARGERADYEKLARFHYVAGRPGTWAGVWVAKYRANGQGGKGQGEEEDGRREAQGGQAVREGRINIEASGRIKDEKNDNPQAELSCPCPLSLLSSRVVAIAVLSWSPLGCTARESILNLKRFPMKERAQWINQNLRTISRVVVHPQFRGVGLGSELVRRILDEAPTRYIETIAAMGKVHPFFEKAGMRRVQHEGEKAYFIFDRDQ